MTVKGKESAVRSQTVVTVNWWNLSGEAAVRQQTVLTEE